jgi:hypothetical protein
LELGLGLFSYALTCLDGLISLPLQGSLLSGGLAIHGMIAFHGMLP